ncbi:MAG: hypothetical protein J7J85_01110 [Deltaproteobacteria bacterium]|nr:hypothetical protein [Deltaproteobacteria bacterium]
MMDKTFHESRKTRHNWFLMLALVLLAAGCTTIPTHYKSIEDWENVELPAYLYRVDNFRTQWWYYTGHLMGEDGTEFGFELCFFVRKTGGDRYIGIPVRYYSNPAHLAHFAITDLSKKKFTYDDRRNKDAFTKNGNGGALKNSLCVWNGDWSVEQMGGKYYLKASMKGYRLLLALSPETPVIRLGDEGRFVKQRIKTFDVVEERGTYYITIPRLKAEGVLFVDGKPLDVTGTAWFDREIGTRQLGENQIGWDWFAIQLDDGTDLMVYLIKNEDATYDKKTSRAILFRSDGSMEEIPYKDMEIIPKDNWISPRTSAEYITSWEIKIKREKLDLKVSAVIQDQEIDSHKSTKVIYWEGKMDVVGIKDGKPVKGMAYLEMCGNAHPVRHLSFNMYSREGER